MKTVYGEQSRTAVFVIKPKIEKVCKRFAELLNDNAKG